MRTRRPIKHAHAQFKSRTRAGPKKHAHALVNKTCTRVGPWKHAHAQVKSSLTESLSHFYHRPNTQIHSSNSWKRTWTRFVVSCSCSRSRSCSWYWCWWTVLKTWKAGRGNEKRTGRPGEESSPLTPHVFRVWHFFFYVSFSFHHRSKHTWTVASWSQLTLSPWKKTV